MKQYSGCKQLGLKLLWSCLLSPQLKAMHPGHINKSPQILLYSAHASAYICLANFLAQIIRYSSFRGQISNNSYFSFFYLNMVKRRPRERKTSTLSCKELVREPSLILWVSSTLPLTQTSWKERPLPAKMRRLQGTSSLHALTRGSPEVAETCVFIFFSGTFQSWKVISSSPGTIE